MIYLLKSNNNNKKDMDTEIIKLITISIALNGIIYDLTFQN